MTKRIPYAVPIEPFESHIVDPIQAFANRDPELPPVPMKLGEIAFKGSMEAMVAVALTADKVKAVVGRALAGRQQ